MDKSFDSNESEDSNESTSKPQKLGKIEIFQNFIKKDIVGLPKIQFSIQNNFWSNISSKLLTQPYSDTPKNRISKQIQQQNRTNSFIPKNKNTLSKVGRSHSLAWSMQIIFNRQGHTTMQSLMDDASIKQKSNFRRGARLVSKVTNQIRNVCERIIDLKTSTQLRRKSCHCYQCGGITDKQYKTMHIGQHTAMQLNKKASELALDSFSSIYQAVTKKSFKKLNTEPSEKELEQADKSIESSAKNHRQSIRSQIKLNQMRMSKQTRISTTSEAPYRHHMKSSIDFTKFQFQLLFKPGSEEPRVQNQCFKPFKLGDQYKLSGYFKFQKNRKKAIKTLQTELQEIRKQNTSQKSNRTLISKDSFQSVIRSEQSPYFQTNSTMKQWSQQNQKFVSAFDYKIKENNQTSRNARERMEVQMSYKMKKNVKL